MRATLTQEQFEAKVRVHNPDLEIGIYKGAVHKILCRDKYGDVLCSPMSLYLSSPSIASAVDKNLYFENQAREVHGDKYGYYKVEYKGGKSKVTINCPIHGSFTQRPSAHLAGDGCNDCGVKSTIMSFDEFLIKANQAHGEYDYSEVEWNGVTHHISIICPTHGVFTKRAESHLIGFGCPSCSGGSSSKDGFIKTAKNKDCYLYIIKCWNENELFYNIRFSSKDSPSNINNDIPYKYEIIYKNTGTASNIWDLKEWIIKNSSSNVYKPMIKFNGFTRSFTKIVGD